MTRKSVHRKHRGVSTTSWAVTIASNQDMNQAHATKIMVALRTAYQRMREGNGDDTDFDRLAAAFNVGLMRAEKIGQPVVDGIASGIGALLSADVKNGTHGRYGFTGPDLLAMNCTLDLYEEILRNSTPRQMQEALEEGARRMRAGHVQQAGIQ